MKARQSGAAPGYIPAIDGLRAIAVGSVILFHLWPGLLPGGFTGVDIFFVISGFVVTGSVIGHRFDSLGGFLGWFYARRLLRIMPALIAMLLATILVAQLFIPEAWLSNTIPTVGSAAFFGLSNIVLATESDDYFAPRAGLNPFTHTWSLGVEEQFYLLFPLLLHWHLRRTGRPMPRRSLVLLVVLLSLASFAAAGALSGAAHRYAFYLIPARFWELGAGMALCLTRDAWLPRLARATVPARIALIAASLVAIGAGFAIPESIHFPFPLALLPVAGALGLIAMACALPAALPTRLLATRPMVGVGRLSYSLYLWHWPVFVLFRWTSGLHTLPLQLAALALAIALALLSYVLVERPLRFGARVRAMPRGRVVGGALAAMALSAGVGIGLFAAHDRLSLSRTRDHALWYADDRRPLDPARSHCRVREERTALAGATVVAWIPEGCAARFTLHAVGDSHNAAYTPAYRQLAAELGVTVRSWTRAGCPFLKLNEPMPGGRCGASFAALQADLRDRVRPGDVIFLPSLRLTRLANQYGRERWADGRRDLVPPATYAEARTILRALAATGAGVVFEAPKPIFPSPPFRCADWFNRTNPVCAPGLTMPRAALERLRGSVHGAMQRLAGEVPGLRVWDPFPILCPGDPCRAIENGRPRFLDGDHLSGHGNDVLYPSFRAAILAARR